MRVQTFNLGAPLECSTNVLPLGSRSKPSVTPRWNASLIQIARQKLRALVDAKAPAFLSVVGLFLTPRRHRHGGRRGPQAGEKRENVSTIFSTRSFALPDV